MTDAPSSGTVRFRLAARIARREVVRRPGRTLLVAMLVAVPVAAMMVGAVLVRTEHLTPTQYWQNNYGRADLVVRADGITDPAKGPIAPVQALLARSKVATERFDGLGRAIRTVDNRRTLAAVAVVAMDDPIVRPMFRITEGRVPKAPDETFLTRAAAHDLGVGVGQQLHLAFPIRQTLRVTGVGERADLFAASEMVLPPSTTYAGNRNDSPSIVRLVELPAGVSTASLERISEQAMGASSPWAVQVSPRFSPWDQSLATADADRKVRWSWVLGAVVLTIAGIVIASAFAAGARRQLVTLGQLAGNGAPPNLLYRVQFLQGTWTGAMGALIGLGLGAGTLLLLRTHVDSIFGHATGGYVIHGGDLLPIVVIGVLAATIAAAVPGRTAIRIPVLAALAGRRPLGKVPRWLPVVGGVMVGAGLALLGLAVLGTRGGTDASTVWMLTAIFGGVSVLLGGCAIAPSYVSVLEPAAAHARGAWRIATRSLARQRTRTGAVVAAIAATSALAIGASALVLGMHSKNVAEARWIASDRVEITGEARLDGSSPPPAAVVRDAARALPRAQRLTVRLASNANLTWQVTSVLAGHESGWEANETENIMPPDIGIADPATLDLYRLSASDRRALTRHGWLTFGTASGRLQFTLTAHPRERGGTPRVHTVDSVMLSQLAHEIGSLPRLLITPAKAASLGLPARVGMVVLRSPGPLTKTQRAAIAEVAQTAADTAVPSTGAVTVDSFTPAQGVDPLMVEWALVGVALALVLFVVTVNLALSAAETRDERDVLTVVGAAPAAMARTSGYKAVMLTIMGALLAIPIGFLPIAVVVRADHGAMPLVFPWRVTMLLAVALPLVGGIVMTLASSAALHLRPVRVSTMTYE